MKSNLKNNKGDSMMSNLKTYKRNSTRNQDNKIKTTEINRKSAIEKRNRNNRSMRITELKRKEWGL